MPSEADVGSSVAVSLMTAGVAGVDSEPGLHPVVPGANRHITDVGEIIGYSETNSAPNGTTIPPIIAATRVTIFAT